MIQLVNEKPKAKRLNTIKSDNPLEADKQKEILEFLKDKERVIYVGWNTQPGVPGTDYKEIWITSKSNDGEYRRLFTISGFNDVVEKEVKGKKEYESVEWSEDKKKHINLSEIKHILSTQPEKFVNLLNKMASARQKYPKAFYSKVEKVINQEKLPFLYAGSAIFEDLEKAFAKTSLDENAELQVAASLFKVDNNEKAAKIIFYDKKKKSFDKQVQYTLMLNPDDLKKLKLDHHATIELLINDPELSNKIKSFELLPKLDFTQHKKVKDANDAEQSVIEYRYSLNRPRKLEKIQTNETVIENANDENLFYEDENVPTIKLKK